MEINFFYGIFKEAATHIPLSRETAGCEFGSRNPAVCLTLPVKAISGSRAGAVSTVSTLL
jgi:hypothetical protein